MTPLLEVFKEEWYRFLIVFLYVCLSAITACLSFTFSSISKSTEIAYFTTEFDIYYITLSYSIYFIPVNFVANYAIDHVGIKPSLIFAAICQLLCSFLRIFISSDIWYVYLAHTIGAIGNPFCTNVISKVSVYWFMPENRMIATAFMTSSYMLGTSLSFSLGGWFIGDDLSLTVDELQNKIQSLLLCTFFLTLSITLAIILLFKEKPKVPTSFVSSIEREDFFVAVKSMAMNHDFRLLCLGFSFLLSNYVIFITFLDYIIGNFGFTQGEVGAIGSSMNLACVVGKVVIGFVAKKYFTYRMTLLIITYTILGSLICLLFALMIQSFGGLLFFSIIFGFFLQMYWAPCLELSCEMVFPMGEANANGNLLLSGCVFNMIFGFAFSELLNSVQGVSSSYLGIAFFSLFYVLASACFYKMKGKLKREETEIEMIVNEKIYYRQIS